MKLFHRRSFPVHHYVLVDQEGSASLPSLFAEAQRLAGDLALQSTGDARNFTLIHNGGLLARREWPHVHIVCARNRFHKWLIYLLIGMKNVVADLFA